MPSLSSSIDLAVRRLQAHRRAVARQLIDGGGDRLGRQRGIQPLQRRAQPRHQHDLALRLAAERAARAEGLLHRRHRLPSRAPRTARWRAARRAGLRCRRGPWLRPARPRPDPTAGAAAAGRGCGGGFWILLREVDSLCQLRLNQSVEMRGSLLVRENKIASHSPSAG